MSNYKLCNHPIIYETLEKIKKRRAEIYPIKLEYLALKSELNDLDITIRTLKNVRP